jgi:hypothetical protein
VGRVRRFSWSVLVALSLLLCVATVELWVCSWWTDVTWNFAQGQERRRIAVTRGQLVVDNLPQKREDLDQLDGYAHAAGQAVDLLHSLRDSVSRGEKVDASQAEVLLRRVSQLQAGSRGIASRRSWQMSSTAALPVTAGLAAILPILATLRRRCAKSLSRAPHNRTTGRSWPARYAANGVTIMSALLAAAAGVASLTSCFLTIGWDFPIGGERCHATVRKGSLVVDNAPQRRYQIAGWERHWSKLRAIEARRRELEKEAWDGAIKGYDLRHKLAAERASLSEQTRQAHREEEELHLWSPAWRQECGLVLPLVASLAGLVPALWLNHWQVCRCRKRVGQCVSCGYDLCATPERCPECGMVVAKGGE